MRTFYRTFTRLTAAALIMAMSAAPGLAAKTTPATDKNTNVPAVPRAIPDLVPYGQFDPPKGAFDLSKLTISGDMRVRPEFRTNGGFGVNQAMTARANDDAFFTQQLIRLGFNYDLSPDVVFFLQPQVSSNWGTIDPDTGSGAINPNGTGSDLFLRQGFMLIRNFLVPNLTLKAGRQLVVWGNHRIFGHFDWNNVGFAFDGVTMRYQMTPDIPLELGWLRVAEQNCNDSAGACANGRAHLGDGDILFARLPMKFGAVAFEPAYIYEDGGASGTNIGGGGGTNAPGGQPGNQQRHTVGARIAGKAGIVDATGEGYWQFGEMGAVGGPSNERINALAVHVDGGVTLPVPMQPRIGAEFNYATGSSDCNAANGAAGTGCGHTFSQLVPTNHIHFGYMDLMSWQNMLTYGGNLQLRPTADSHFEIAGHIMRLANKNDQWYGANQAVFKTTPAGNNEKSLGGEIDVVYTLFFQNNKVGWQLGYGHFFDGDYVKKGSGGQSSDQNWGYTQLWINF
ncbi:MAG: alginate export family protein [Nitrospirales bacterium]|nr:alginate export family protein [Nitrospirales bacterium]